VLRRKSRERSVGKPGAQSHWQQFAGCATSGDDRGPLPLSARQISCTMDLLQIVYLETNDADAELVGAELKSSAIECEVIRARSLPELTSELAQRPVDIVLADRHGPAYDGLRALAVAREKVPGVPFIFVSGTDDSGQVGELLRAGATDFILKDHLPRLVPSIRRVIQETHT